MSEEQEFTPPPVEASPEAAPPPPSGGGDASKKVPAGILGILLGALGVHKFYLGYNKEGIIMLVVCLVGALACGIGPAIAGVIGLVEGILYLTKSDEEFVATYITGNKPWF